MQSITQQKDKHTEIKFIIIINLRTARILSVTCRFLLLKIRNITHLHVNYENERIFLRIR